jgi:hypothetical protein
MFSSPLKSCRPLRRRLCTWLAVAALAVAAWCSGGTNVPLDVYANVFR